MKYIIQILLGFYYFLFPFAIVIFVGVMKVTSRVYRLIHVKEEDLSSEEEEFLVAGMLMKIAVILLIGFSAFTSHWYILSPLIFLHILPKKFLGVPQIRFIALLHLLCFFYKLSTICTFLRIRFHSSTG